MEKECKLILPAELIEKHNFKPNSEIKIKIIDPVQKTYFDSKLNNINKSLSYKVLIPSFILTIFYFSQLSFSNQSRIPLIGRESISSLIFILGTISGLLFFTYQGIDQKRKGTFFWKNISWKNFPSIITASTSLLMLSLMAIFQLLDKLFIGVIFDKYTATLIFFIFLTLINQFMSCFCHYITPSLLLKVFIIIIIGGTSISMINNQNLIWWEKNFSFLGTNQANNAWIFNLTLIISALLFITIISYIFQFIQITSKHKFNLLHNLLIMMAIALAGIGIFPNNGNGILHFLHIQTSRLLACLILLLIFTLKWLIPDINQFFIKKSYFIGSCLIISIVLFEIIHYLSLTTFELIISALSILWITLLLHYLLNFSTLINKNYKVTIKII